MLKLIMLVFGLVVIDSSSDSLSFGMFLCYSLMWAYALYHE